MSKLLLVSNRVPASGAKAEPGGLAVALSQALQQRGGTWLGWSGAISEKAGISERSTKRVRTRTMDFTRAEYDGYYAGFCNSVLWPLCHYRTDLCQYAPEMFEAYDHVNKKFAIQVMEVLAADHIVWAHDYHLLLLGSHLRARGVTQKLGFFMHIPFPVPEIFAAVPHGDEILNAIAAYDLVGFQTATDLQAFLRCMKGLAVDAVVTQESDDVYSVTAFGRIFKAARFPISIETTALMTAAERSDSDPQTVKLCETLDNKKMLIGVDRLDYTKGLVERLGAYQHLLQQWPDWCGNVSYVQITPPSRSDLKDYGKIREQLEQLSARVNGMNAEINWTPIRYINRSFTRNQLAGFYRNARVGLVTPLRDGMNLVAKEYVACQNPVNPGVLVLSKFAGAAGELKGGALLVNPYNTAEMAANIHRALTMSLDERVRRYRTMIEVIRRDDIFVWSEKFLACLGENHADSLPPLQTKASGGFFRRFGHIDLSAGHISSFMRSLSPMRVLSTESERQSF